MHWLCLYFPRLSLECRLPLPESPTAVVERVGTRRQLIACNEACSAAGLAPGLDLIEARARCPELRLLPRAPRQEQASLKALAAWAGQFGDRLTLDPSRQLLWVCIGPSLRYFGGVDALLGRVRAGLQTLGYAASDGVAPTLEAAALLARLGLQTPLAEVDLAAALAALPVTALPLPVATLQALDASGLEHIGAVLALPAAALARRFGPQCVNLLQRLSGAAPDPRPTYRLPVSYRRRCELVGGIDRSEALLFPLRRLLGELEGFLRARDAAVRELRLRFRHDEQPDTVLSVHATRPLRSAARLLVLLRERLERCALPAATDEIHLEVPVLVASGDTQLSLLDSSAQAGAEWSEVLDRLRARLGESAVHGLGLRDDHRPERAWCAVDTEPANAVPPPSVERPLWLLQPRPLQSLPATLGTPERIEVGWWDGEAVARDYYRADTDAGGQLWLYRDHHDRCWYLHGLWA